MLEALLWVAAAIALGTVGWSLIDAARFQSLGMARLGSIAADADASSNPLLSSRLARIPIPAGTPLAALEIPRLGIEAVVAEGDSPRVLRRAVGHLPHTARPGEIGNIALAGHRDTFFRGLGDIRAGDEIVLSGEAGADVYRVEWTRVVAPDRVDVLRPTGHNALTLITCYPFRWIGPAPERFVVRARRVGSRADLGARTDPEATSPCSGGPSSAPAC